VNQSNPNAGMTHEIATSPGDSVDAMARARDLEELERIRRAVMAVGEATYHWDTASDRLVWSSNVTDVINGADLDRISTGKGFADLLDPDNFTSRYDTVMRSAHKDDGNGVPFSIEYVIKPGSRSDDRSVWIEDTGRWYAGKHGQPTEVFGIIRQIDDRHERDQELRFMGNCDPLTGLMNRGRLSDALSETMATAAAKKGSCAFLIAVINNLAVVNDAYGFDVADEVMVAVSQRLKRVIRTGDMIGRYSGAKFGIILGNCTEAEIKVAAERFLSIARDSVIETERGPVWAMLSIGGVVLPKFTDSASTAMAQAEEALAQAKRQSTDSFVAYVPSEERISVRSLNARCAAEIISGLKHDRFALAYQPIVDATTKQPVLQEALLRMRCEDGETVAAYHLIPIAEKLGLVRLIDRAVAQLAVDALAENTDLSISLNVSGITATDPRWFGQFTDILSSDHQIAERIIVEITETVALHELEETISFTRKLREIGCRVAIDDFGAGYSSFKNLRELEVDMVKIDGSYCQNLSTNTDNQYFVKSLIELAKKFNLVTTAEWVQTEEDAELLRAWGVDYLQGNLFGEATIDVPWALRPDHTSTSQSRTAQGDSPESDACAFRTAGVRAEVEISAPESVPDTPIGEAELRGADLDAPAFGDTSALTSQPEPEQASPASQDDSNAAPFAALPLELEKVINEAIPQDDQFAQQLPGRTETEASSDTTPAPLGNPEAHAQATEVPFSFAPGEPAEEAAEDSAPFVANHIPAPETVVEPDNEQTEQPFMMAAPAAATPSDTVTQADKPISNELDVDLEADDDLGLDQSLLKSALSQLDNTFGKKSAPEKPATSKVA
jgi:diguanylate cyclase (GGDEF)-like protein